MSVIAVAGMKTAATDGCELMATPNQRESPYWVALRHESEKKEPGGHFAALDQANCYAEVPGGSLADVSAVKLELELMMAA